MRKYLSIEDISYKSGDSISIHWEDAGFITTGGESFRMTLPVDRDDYTDAINNDSCGALFVGTITFMEVSL